MKRRNCARVFLASAIVSSVTAVSACRQPDGPIPRPSSEQENKIGDLGRDLQNVSRGDATAAGEMRDDLGSFGSVEAPPEHVAALSAALTSALQGKMFSDEVSARLARQPFVALSADELSERQAEALQRELEAVLAEAGVASVEGQSVVDAIRALREAIGTNAKRWWHRG